MCSGITIKWKVGICCLVAMVTTQYKISANYQYFGDIFLKYPIWIHKEGDNKMLSGNTIQCKAVIGCLSYLFALVITQKIGHKISYKGGLTARYGITRTLHSFYKYVKSLKDQG